MYSDGSLFDLRAKMNTSRKLRVKLAFSKESHLQRSCPKRTRARTYSSMETTLAPKISQTTSTSPANALLHGPQFRIAWLSVATETIGFHGDHVGPQNITDHINQPSQRAAPWPTISDGDHVGPQNITDHINQPSQRAAPWPTISDSLAIGRN